MPDFKRYFLLRVLIIFLILTGCSRQANDTIQGEVIGVSDGDTIKLLLQGKQVKVRLAGIDSPERSQPYGKKAKEFTFKLAYGTMVSVIVHGTDQYGRILGEVILPGGANLNEELVANGYAWHYTEYSESKRLNLLQKGAQEKSLGLWKEPKPTPPWEFRRMRKRERIN